MKLLQEVLLAILKIGHETSMRGEGISLHEALRKVDYVNIRKKLSEADLIPIIYSNQSIIDEWIMYSEDKRTSGGFALNSELVEKADTNSKCEIVTKYILMELDFWATFQ